MADEVKIAYDKAKKNIHNLIGFLECELEKEPENLDWGYVGDLNRIKNNLTETLTSITCFNKEEIENSLQEV